MTVSVNWPTGVITIPQAELTHLSGANYELGVDAFRLALKDLEDSEEGAVWPDTHRHATASELSGVTYARQVEILAPYTITFQDVGTPYTVNCVGANHNIADVKNVNQVSLIVGNSAGLISVATGSGVTSQDKTDIITGVWNTSDALLLRKMLANKVLKSGNIITIYDDDNTSIWRQYDLSDGGRVRV